MIKREGTSLSIVHCSGVSNITFLIVTHLAFCSIYPGRVVCYSVSREASGFEPVIAMPKAVAHAHWLLTSE